MNTTSNYTISQSKSYKNYKNTHLTISQSQQQSHNNHKKTSTISHNNNLTIITKIQISQSHSQKINFTFTKIDSSPKFQHHPDTAALPTVPTPGRLAACRHCAQPRSPRARGQARLPPLRTQAQLWLPPPAPAARLGPPRARAQDLLPFLPTTEPAHAAVMRSRWFDGRL
jgi:hypothetical protein